LYDRPRARIALATLLLGLLPGALLAHHSFAVFFDEARMISVKGRVDEFLFRNPHGIIKFTVVLPDGSTAAWRAESNSPSILERRGWTRDSLKPGDMVEVEGWPARDGSNYLRMRKVTRPDGTVVGIPFEQAEQK
jgi:Family of unknown function (DUF6152)